jgi:hypothetical protein
VLEKKRRPGKETLGRRAPLDASTRSVDEPTGRASNGAGSVYWRGGRAFMRLSLGRMGRRTIALPSAATEAQAVARAAVVAKLARRLLAAGQIELGLPLLERAASRDGKALEAVVAAVETLCKGEARARPSGSVTIEDLGKRWTSGELARDYPDHVRAKASAEGRCVALRSLHRSRDRPRARRRRDARPLRGGDAPPPCPSRRRLTPSRGAGTPPSARDGGSTRSDSVRRTRFPAVGSPGQAPARRRATSTPTRNGNSLARA